MVVVLAVTAALLARFLLASSPAVVAQPNAAAMAVTSGGGAQAAADRAITQLRQRPDDPTLLRTLGVAYYARAKETADPTYYDKADQALTRSDRLAPDQPDTLTALGVLAGGRHRFVDALALGQRAHQLAPASPSALGVIVDAEVELGRYDVAAASAQTMLDLRPNIASLSRASYLRELHGDTAGALLAMQEAATAGAQSPADIAYVQTLLGDLQRQNGNLAGAADAYAIALRSDAGYPLAVVGTAHVAATRGDLRQAADILAGITVRFPLPEALAFYGDVQTALGDVAGARDSYALVRTSYQLQEASGVIDGLESGRFEADHARDTAGVGGPAGDPTKAVALARQSLADRPTIYGEDLLGWALRQAGDPVAALPHARAAAALGTRDVRLRYHLAAVEADLALRPGAAPGLLAAARADLAAAFAIDPSLDTRYLPAATPLAARLGVAVPPLAR